MVSKTTAAMGPLGDAGSEQVVVSEVIYQAATDKTNQLRYTAGKDAAQMVAQRKENRLLYILAGHQVTVRPLTDFSSLGTNATLSNRSV